MVKDNPRIEKEKKCPICGNDKAWTSRGNYNPLYSYKCTKCGNKDYSTKKGNKK